MTDRLDPTLSLSAEELERAREIAQADPEALGPAICAALLVDDGDALVKRMLGLLRGGPTCES